MRGPRHQWRAWAVLTVVGTVLTALLTAAVMAPTVRTAVVLGSRGVITTAEVVDYREALRSRDDRWTLRFTTVSGRTVQVSTRATWTGAPLRVGSRVTVRYDPRRPSRVWSTGESTDLSWWAVVFGWVVGLVSLGFAVLGLFLKPWQPPSPPAAAPAAVPARPVPPRVARRRREAARRERMRR
ncbi:DUF3592 domain-containing protein [Kineococcus sp. SYSU DK001]|uniref:DUF3592 domain-containing protein n=1 Tax=Kineococcus sp. SYSU DK001 TaxID=3383122 RepID=UPI003D7D5D1F